MTTALVHASHPAGQRPPTHLRVPDLWVGQCVCTQHIQHGLLSLGRGQAGVVGEGAVDVLLNLAQHLGRQRLPAGGAWWA